MQTFKFEYKNINDGNEFETTESAEIVFNHEGPPWTEITQYFYQFLLASGFSLSQEDLVSYLQEIAPSDA